MEVDWITGCCILIKTSLVEKVGLLDENFFAYFEDVDWSIRMQELGYRWLLKIVLFIIMDLNH